MSQTPAPPSPVWLPRPTRALATLVDRWAEPRSRVVTTGLHGGALAYLLASALPSTPWPILALTPDEAAAERLESDLRFFLGEEAVDRLRICPDWDVLPYDGRSPHVEIAADRVAALTWLRAGRRGTVLVAPIRALLKRVPAPETLSARTLELRKGARLDHDRLVSDLSRMGYLGTDRVVEVGSWSVRGGVIDVYPPGEFWPVRVELWGDEIDSLRTFDPTSQRSMTSLQRVRLSPAREEMIFADDIALARQRLKERGDRDGVAPHHRHRLVEDLQEGLFFPNIEYYLPVLTERPTSFLDHATPSLRVVLVDEVGIHDVLKGWDEQVRRGYDARMAHEPLLPAPEELFISTPDLCSEIEQLPLLIHNPRSRLEAGARLDLKTEPTAGLRQTILSYRGDGVYTPLVERIQAWDRGGLRTFVACHAPVQAQRLADLLKPYGLRVPLGGPPTFTGEPPAEVRRGPAVPHPLLGNLSAGFSFPEAGIAVLSEVDVLGTRVQSPAPSARLLKSAIDSFSQLKAGDLVVHAVHGIGIFQGLAKLPMGDRQNDFVLIEYVGGDKLYLPVHRLNTLQRYVGQKGEAPKLDKMGGLSWSKTTRKVKESVLKVARQLLELYARRAMAKGHAHRIDRLALEELEASFPYDETPDQLEAIAAVLKDLASPQPMDRLVCGDVGYGKTEVAIRAAYAAVLSGTQVLVLVPTTVLAFQHFQTFKSRFADLPVTVAQLSRFVTPEEEKKVIAGVASGGVDIVVGTHRLLGEDVKPTRLGLVIIDEEHRFGVKHKEHLKKLRKNVDVMTMTATPIPRTLHMAMTGLRDLSIIATPPKDRMSIRTFVAPFSARIIQEAIREELEREGQVFFVHNRIQSIGAMAQLLSTLAPDARIEVLHGQMSEARIEETMVRFVKGEADVLVSTSLIESGIDLPRANTIIVNRADRFGLAQLYQLRGRVGRSDKRAWAYLLTPAAGPPSPEAQRRLRALEIHSDLGAGFHIANEDLEMRGAGALLGANQSGSIAAVGFETYVELLHRAIQELSGGDAEDDFDPDVDVRVDASIPEDYIPDFQERLDIYRRLSMTRTAHELAACWDELEDRYGAAPPPVIELRGIMEIRILAKQLRIIELKAMATRISLRFDASGARVDPARLARLAQRLPDRVKLTPDGRLTYRCTEKEGEALVEAARNLLQSLG